MFEKISIKKVLIIILLFIIWVFVFFYLNFSSNNDILENTLERNHNWVPIGDILTDENYKKVWINPDKYNTFEAFLQDFKSFSWVLVNPITEKFVIWINTENSDIIFIPFDFKNDKLVFDDKVNKNLAILDIYNAYKNQKLYWWVDSSLKSKILFEKDLQHPKTNELNKIFSVNVNDKSNNVFTKIKTLEKSDEIWIGNMELLAYLYDFTWDYSKWKEERKSICEKYKQKCDLEINVTASWTVIWLDWLPVKWAKIELLNDTTINTLSDNNWNFSLNFKHSSFSHLRFKTSLTWYSDWFSTISLNNVKTKDSIFDINFIISKSDNITSINSLNSENYIKWRYYLIESENSKYYIPIKWLYYQDWNKFVWNNLDIYTYLFKKSSNMDSMLENDTFEPVYWYVWNIMKTFWMPYIQFIDKDTWKELFIKSSDPMILQNQIYHMKELYENHDKIYQELTKDDMLFLVQKSEELWWYPIDFDFLTQNNILRWPAWWSLDRVTWIWHNVWCRVVNVDWLVELPFYHIDDSK